MAEGFSYRYCPFLPGPEYRSVFMNEVFELTYHGGGGFSYFDVWNMPVSHRKYHLRKIKEYLQLVEDKRNEQMQQVTERTDMSKFKIPEHVKQASKDFSYVSNVKGQKKP